MKSKNSVIKNYIFNASYKAVVLLTPLITTPYLARVLGVDPIGVYSFTSANVAIFVMIATLGSYIYGSREISFVQQDRKAYSKIFWEVEFLSILVTLIVGIAFGIFVALQTDYFMVYLVQCISLIGVAVNVSWLFQGLEDFKRISLINIIFRLLNLVYIFVAVHGPNDLLIYIIGNVGIEVIGFVSMWAFVPKYVDRPNWRELRPLSHLKGTVMLFIPTIATTIYTIFDKTMIGLFTDAKTENGYYEYAMKLPKTALVLLTATESVIIPRVGNLFVNHKDEELRELLYKVFRFVWFLSVPLALGLFSVAEHFVPWFYGDGYDKVVVLLRILCFIIPCIGFSNVAGVQYLMATKRENKVSATVFGGAAVNLMLNLVLIPQIYSVGAAIASVIAECVITGLQLFLIRKELSVGKIIWSGWRYVVSGIVMTVALWFIGKPLAPGAKSSAILIVIGAVIYFVMLFILRDSMLKMVLEEVKKKLKKQA